MSRRWVDHLSGAVCGVGWTQDLNSEGLDPEQLEGP